MDVYDDISFMDVNDQNKPSWTFMNKISLHERDMIMITYIFMDFYDHKGLHRRL